jgi:microcystin-dependent protein
LFLDGTSYAVSAYNDLFNVIGYTFGGSGSNFNVPDSRGEFFRGWDAGRGVDTGRGFGTWQDGGNESHSHPGSTLVSDPGHLHGISPQPPTTATTQAASGSDITVATGAAGAAATQTGGAHTHTVNISADGISESRPRNIAVSYFIKAFNPNMVTPVDTSSTQTISGQKTFAFPVILPSVPQALIFGDPTATGTFAIGVIGGNLAVTVHTSAGPWALVNIIS